jgi:hypothetical protein
MLQRHSTLPKLLQPSIPFAAAASPSFPFSKHRHLSRLSRAQQQITTSGRSTRHHKLAGEIRTLNPDTSPAMGRSAATRLARAAHTAAAAARSRAAGSGGRDVLPRALAPLAGDASTAATAAARRPSWLAGVGRLPVAATSAGGLLLPQRRLFHSTTPAQYSAAGTSSQVRGHCLPTPVPLVESVLFWGDQLLAVTILFQSLVV